MLYQCSWALLFFSIFCSFAGEHYNYFVIVPGLNGSGGQNIKSDTLPSAFQEDAIDIIPSSFKVRHAGTQHFLPDLGQRRCLNHLAQTMQPLQYNQKNQKIIMYTVSQGTATGLTYVSKHPEKVCAIVCESVLASPNSAIWHTMKNSYKSIESVPLFYSLMPHLARLCFPFYNPTQQEPLFNTQNISNDTTIILLHATRDKQIPFLNAGAMYYALRAQGHTNTYLFSVVSNYHHMILNNKEHTKEITAIRYLLAKAAGQECATTDVSLYQPNYLHYKSAYDHLVRKQHQLRKDTRSFFVGCLLAWFYLTTLTMIC